MPYLDPQKAKENKKEYYLKNKEIFLQKQRERYNDPEYKKNHTIKRWIKRGVVYPDFDSLYIHYENATHCDMCKKEFVAGKRNPLTKCLDHCHKTGEFRNFVCHACNMKMKMID